MAPCWMRWRAASSDIFLRRRAGRSCLASEPKILRARSTATEAMETELEPIWVSVRTFLATVKARWRRDVERGGDGADLAGDGVGLLDLAEDLRLADDHGVERAGDAEEMADGFALAELVEMGLDVVGRDGEVLVQEAEEVGRLSGWRLRVVLQGEELDAVAGGEDEAFADAGLVERACGWRRRGGGGDGEALADLDGRGVVVDAEEDQAAVAVLAGSLMGR